MIYERGDELCVQWGILSDGDFYRWIETFWVDSVKYERRSDGDDFVTIPVIKILRGDGSVGREYSASTIIGRVL
jgi:hypothetical protein